MLYIVQFEDHPDVAELREKLFASHIEFLDRNKDRVLVPGSLREVPSDKPIGGLWIVEAANEEAGGEILAGDPFWVNGVRARVRINRWHKACPDRRVPSGRLGTDRRARSLRGRRLDGTIEKKGLRLTLGGEEYQCVSGGGQGCPSGY